MMLLNAKQKDYLFKIWFSDEDIHRIFAKGKSWLMKQKVSIKSDNGYARLYINGREYASIDIDGYKRQYDKLKDIGEHYEKNLLCKGK